MGQVEHDRHRGPDVTRAADELQEAMAAQLEDHQRLLRCIERKEAAIRSADIEAVTRICQEENGIAQRLGELEKQRLGLVGRITESLHPGAETPLTVSAIAEAIDDPARTRLLALGEQLRATVGQVRRASSVVRSAAEALSRHMTGIRQTVESALSRAGVYGKRGRIALGAQLQFSVDIKS